MKLKMFQIDAFTSESFKGNSAAVLPLKKWLDDSILQNIAMENNLSETAFFVPTKNGFDLRWMTPEAEVDMCGHATLAAAFVLFNDLKYEKEKIVFNSKSGELIVTKEGDLLSMDFPAQKITQQSDTQKYAPAFNKEPLEVYESMDHIFVFEDEDFIKEVEPDLSFLRTLDGRGVVITAKSKEYDFVSRMFAPKYGIDEDPVTGSAFTQLVTYWSQKLKKSKFHAKQVSARGGEVRCELRKDRCILKGKAVKYFEGKIHI